MSSSPSPALTSRWTQAHALKIRADDPTATMPVIAYDFPVVDPARWQADSWALRNLRGQTVTYKGWHVLFSLVADRAATGDTVAGWHRRNDFSSIGYYYSRDGVRWIFGGKVLSGSAHGRSWEWSGCSVMREGSNAIVDLFFTSVNQDPAQSVIAHTEGRLEADENGVRLICFDKVTDLFEADGVHYANQAENPYWDFRDPYVFIAPEDGDVYAVFEGNLAGMRGSFALTQAETGPLPPGFVAADGAQFAAGCIGLARCVSDWKNGDFSQWEMRAPLVSSLGVNDQLERPHLVFKNGLTYLFATSHSAFFAPKLAGPDGLYGFVSRTGLFGPYAPLNGSGLVLGNPTHAPFMTSAPFVDAEGYVHSFIDTLPAEDQNPAHPAIYRIGGTLAPTVRLALDGENTYLTEIKNYGQIIAPYDWASHERAAHDEPTSGACGFTPAF